MKFKIAIFMFLGLLINACGDDDRVVDTRTQNKPAFGFANNNLAQFDLITKNILKQININELSKSNVRGEIWQIKINENKIYTFSESNSISVFNKSNFEFIVDYNFDEKPIDISIPNSTDAYVVLENSNRIVLVDIYNESVVKTINANYKINQLIIIGNQGFVSCIDSDIIYKFDTRIYDIVDSLKFETKVYSIAVSDKFEKLAIIYHDNDMFKIQFMNISNKTNLASINLEFGNIDKFKFEPKKIISTFDDYIYILTNDLIYRADFVSMGNIALLDEGHFDDITYSYINQEIAWYKNIGNSTEISFINSLTGKINGVQTYNFLINAISY